MKFQQYFNATKFLVLIGLLTTTMTSIIGQSLPPCPPPPTVSYMLTVSPSNTISAGTFVTFKVKDNGTGSFINDICSYGEWFVNGIYVFGGELGDGISTTSYGYTTNSLLDNDVVTCTVKQTCACTATTIYTVDNPITMHVSGVLPIELLNFSGNTEGGINRLFWSTATEVNNKGFQIERLSSTAKTWETLGFISAQGKAANYEFTDSHPLSIGYYRLRQIDTDGKEHFSKVINLLIVKEKHLAVYPNPATQVLNIDFISSDKSEKEKPLFHIFNILGQRVQTGTLTNTIDVSALTLGTYFLKVGTEQVKFYKQ
jgi:hypothetical protein